MGELLVHEHTKMAAIEKWKIEKCSRENVVEKGLLVTIVLAPDLLFRQAAPRRGGLSCPELGRNIN